MNEFAKKWVEALRSGEYEQGSGYLCNKGGFCCLGVAEDLAGTEYKETCGSRLYGAEERESCLTSDTRAKLGLATCYGESGEGITLFTPHGPVEFLSLTVINDSGYFTFNQIADIIEESEHLLFEKGGEDA